LPEQLLCHRLADAGGLREEAEALVTFHNNYRAAAADPGFPEREPYAEVSVRDLLRVVDHAKAGWEQAGELPSMLVSASARRMICERFRVVRMDQKG
jgi:hypothetical protein